MKKYIKMLAIISFIFTYAYSDNIGIAPKDYIVPTQEGPDAIVNAIKKYSNITKDDVNKYKLLWLGWFGAVPTLAIGGASTYGGYKAAEMVFDSEKVRGAVDLTRGAFNYIGDKTGLLSSSPVLGSSTLSPHGISLPGSGMMQSSVDMMSNFLKTRTPWMAAAAVGAGFISYKMFYPRIRQGVLNKVQKFLDLCKRLTVAQKDVLSTSDIPEWSMTQDIAVCRAFNNLEEQARFAATLLAQVGLNDHVVYAMNERLKSYHKFLQNNKNSSTDYCNQLITRYTAEEQRADRELQREGVKAQIFGQKIQNVKNVVSIMQKVGNGIFNFARDVTNFGIENKAPLGMLGAGYWLYKKMYPSIP